MPLLINWTRSWAAITILGRNEWKKRKNNKFSLALLHANCSALLMYEFVESLQLCRSQQWIYTARCRLITTWNKNEAVFLPSYTLCCLSSLIVCLCVSPRPFIKLQLLHTEAWWMIVLWFSGSARSAHMAGACFYSPDFKSQWWKPLKSFAH